ncbi:MAG: spermidine/putrescine ABC transporter substrate-binding protein [Ruminococcaceae bacterium]|nr:spermidine/putrescine ABC transporter substrate-binding protein [Oscillospiraceae bacterium]
MKTFIKRTFIFSLVLLSLLLLTAVFSSCSKDESSDVTTLYVYNWGEYISDGSEGTLNVNKEFENWYYETYGKRVKVSYSTYSSNEDMYAKLSGGAVNYDVIVPSDYMIERLISEDMLAPLNYGNIPNIENILPEFYGEDAKYDYYDKGSIYSVPYFYGMIGIIYNTTMVDPDDEDIGSWSLMWDDDYKGNILQFNNSRDAFGTAQYYLGIDVNTDDIDEWRLALKKLLEQKDFVQGYVMDEIFNKMENGSAAIAAYYAGDFLAMYENNEDLEFFYPKEGTNLYVDAMCIPKTSHNKELAEMYINFMLSEEIAVANAEYTYYASPNRTVVENEEYIEYMSEIKEDAYEKMYGTDGVNATAYVNLTSQKLALVNELWEELKSNIDVSPTIYVICAVIVISIASLTVFFGVRKKIRNNY